MALARSSEDLAQAVAANVRAELARRRLSARQLAEQLDVSPEWLSRRMTGAVPISVADLDRIAGRARPGPGRPAQARGTVGAA